MAANFEEFQAAKAARAKPTSDRGGRGRGRGRGGGRGRGRGRGGGGSRPPWTQNQKDARAKNQKDQHEAKVLLAAFKDKGKTTSPTTREQQLSDFAKQFDPTQVLAVTGNAAHYSALPARLTSTQGGGSKNRQ